eukprot:247818_1
MEEIIELINNIMKILNYKLNENIYFELIESLILLIKNDYNYITYIRHNIIPDNIYRDLITSDSNLNLTLICSLLYKFITISPQIIIQKKKLFSDKLFCRQLISKNYNESQVNVICEIVKQNIINDNNFDVFNMIIEFIHLRLAWLDFHEVYAALHIFNQLFNDNNDPFIQEKLQTQCLTQHLQKIVFNLKCWKLTQISLALLAELCNENILVRSWM